MDSGIRYQKQVLDGVSKRSRWLQEADKGVLCGKCEHLNISGRRVCEYCGFALYRTCSHCGRLTSRVLSECENCGVREEKKVIDKVSDKFPNLDLKTWAIRIGVSIVVISIFVFLIVWFLES